MLLEEKLAIIGAAGPQWASASLALLLPPATRLSAKYTASSKRPSSLISGQHFNTTLSAPASPTAPY